MSDTPLTEHLGFNPHVKCDFDLTRLGREVEDLTRRLAEARAERLSATTLLKSCAWWYACGYNDNRVEGQPWADADAFMDVWVALNDQASRPSLQDAFKTFMAEAWRESVRAKHQGSQS